MRSSDQQDLPEHEKPDALSAQLQPAIESERAAMDNDLQRARGLLRDGMAKLHDFFDTLNATVSTQSELLSKLSDATTPEPERQAALAQLRADHEQVLSLSKAAILGLQLEDVLGQLIDYTCKRADGIASLAALLAAASDPQAIFQHRELGPRLRSLLAEADQRARTLTVQQASLETGDVELF